MPVVETNVSQYQACIDQCNHCMQICEECFQSCLKEPDLNARAKCISLLKECSDICSMASRFMAANSQHSKDICGVCAMICDSCANECAMFQDSHCQQCAAECRKCASMCREMSNK
jgi:hypothetical protein